MDLLLEAWCETRKIIFQGSQPRGFQVSWSGVLGLMHQVPRRSNEALYKEEKTEESVEGLWGPALLNKPHGYDNTLCARRDGRSPYFSFGVWNLCRCALNVTLHSAPGDGVYGFDAGRAARPSLYTCPF